MKSSNNYEENHADGIKKSFEKMMGVDLSLKRKRKSENDTKKEIFEKIINTLEKININENILANDFDLELAKYNENFYEVIDNLIYMLYGKEAAEVIFFYLYERINPDGTSNGYEVKDKDGNVLPLENPSDLWNVINYVNNTNKK